MSWSSRFDDPVPGIRTHGDAAIYIMNLPASDKRKPHWKAAAQALLMAAEDRGTLMLAQIGMLRALNHGKPDPKIAPPRKRAKVYKIVRG